MKIPERLIGFIDYEGTMYPFEFNADTFYLNLYPPNKEIWRKTSSIEELLKSFAPPKNTNGLVKLD